MNSKIGIIIGREYTERVSKKSFIISTILMPLLMLGLMIAPALITIFSTADTKTIAVIDNSKVIAQSLKSNDEINYISLDVPLDSALANADIDGVLLIEESILTSSTGVSLYTNEASSLTIEQNITSQIENTIEEQRLKNYDIENLEEILDAVKANVSLQTYRNDQEAGSNASSSFLSYIIGTIMTFMLYIFLLLYGQMVMTSIIEEKNNRVLEIVVSSIKPAQLMMGKIIGIGLVAVTQVLIWAALISVISGSLLPALLPTEVMNEVTAFNNGTIDINTATNDADLYTLFQCLGMLDTSYLFLDI